MFKNVISCIGLAAAALAFVPAGAQDAAAQDAAAQDSAAQDAAAQDSAAQDAAAQDAAGQDAAQDSTAGQDQTVQDAAQEDAPQQAVADVVVVEDDEFFDRTPEDCIITTRIRETEVLDDRTILFYLRGGRIYRNFLAENCPGLGRSKRFIMQTRTSRLCDIDTITVLEQFASRFDRGFTCRLGEFHPVTAAEAELMELEPDAAAAAGRSVEITPVELPDDEQGERDDSEPEPAGSAEAGAAAEDAPATPDGSAAEPAR